jgi:hypothetical protein
MACACRLSCRDSIEPVSQFQSIGDLEAQISHSFSQYNFQSLRLVPAKARFKIQAATAGSNERVLKLGNLRMGESRSELIG